MPQSDPFNIPWVIRLIGQIKPKSILDIGIGTGTYGMLCRQYLDIANVGIHKEDWTTKIDGVEIFRDYENPIWPYFYNQVYIGNALDEVRNLEHYDLILLVDVIEHFTKNEGLTLLNLLFMQSNWLIITSPKGKFPQGELYGNIHEVHHSEWNYNDFTDYSCLEIPLDVSNLYLLTKKPENLKMINLWRIPRMVYPAKYIRSIFINVARGLIVDIKSRFRG